MSKKVKCPVCREDFELEEDLEVGDTTHCSSCYEELKLVSLNPPRVEEIVDSLYDEYYEEDEEDDYGRRMGREEEI